MASSRATSIRSSQSGSTRLSPSSLTALPSHPDDPGPGQIERGRPRSAWATARDPEETEHLTARDRSCNAGSATRCGSGRSKLEWSRSLHADNAEWFVVSEPEQRASFACAPCVLSRASPRRSSSLVRAGMRTLLSYRGSRRRRRAQSCYRVLQRGSLSELQRRAPPPMRVLCGVHGATQVVSDSLEITSTTTSHARMPARSEPR